MTSYFDGISVLAMDLVGTLIFKPTPRFHIAASDFLAKYASLVTPGRFRRTFRRRYWEHSIGNYETDWEFYSWHYYALHYEALTVHPRGECEKLCAFLGLVFDDAMLHVDRAKPDPGLELKRAGLPVIPGLRDWQSPMSAQELERFGATAGEPVDELNYPRASSRSRPEVLDYAASVRCSLAQDLRARD